MKLKNPFGIALVTLVILTASKTALLAQSPEQNTLSIEIIGGASLLKNTGYWEDHMSSKFGYSGGLGFSYAITPSFSISTRGLWELKGSKTQQNLGITIPDEGTSEHTYHLNTNYSYLTITMLPTFHFGPSKRIEAGGGAYYSFLKNAKVERQDDDLTNNTTTYRSFDDPSNFHTKYDVGVSVFAGYTFVIIGESNCSVVIMYNKGLVDVEDSFNDYQRNNSVQVQFVFSIPVLKRHKAL